MMVLQKLFGFDPSKHSVKTEIMAGLTSFLTMAYILAVNPGMQVVYFQQIHLPIDFQLFLFFSL